MELVTEFDPGTPLTEQATRVLEGVEDPTLRQRMEEPDFTDSTLSCGQMRMRAGHAFLANPAAGQPGTHDDQAMPVGKRTAVIGGRHVLIEAVECQRIRSVLEKLPSPNRRASLRSTQGFDPHTSLARNSIRHLPPPPAAPRRHAEDPNRLGGLP